MANWTPRVSHRALLAEKLLEQPDRYAPAGLLEADLREIAEQGRAGEAADEQQKAQLAEASTAVSDRKATAKKAVSLETEVRNRIPAIVRDLERAGRQADALWLKRLSFSRYRMREVAPPAGDAPAGELETLRAVERVPRADMPTRMRSLAAWTDALLDPSRTTIADAFAARALPRTDLEELSRTARTLAEAGRNVMAPAEATKRESEAVSAQRSA